MAESTGQDEQVPDQVGELEPGVERKKDDAAGIGEAAGDQPAYPRCRHPCEQRLGGEHHQPAHQQIEDGGQHRVFIANEALEHHAGDSQPPDDAEQRPADGAVQHAETDRRVGAGDQQEDLV